MTRWTRQFAARLERQGDALVTGGLIALALFLMFVAFFGPLPLKAAVLAWGLLP